VGHCDAVISKLIANNIHADRMTGRVAGRVRKNVGGEEDAEEWESIQGTSFCGRSIGACESLVSRLRTLSRNKKSCICLKSNPEPAAGEPSTRRCLIDNEKT
jgi:hypothetical protein